MEEYTMKNRVQIIQAYYEKLQALTLTIQEKK